MKHSINSVIMEIHIFCVKLRAIDFLVVSCEEGSGDLMYMMNIPKTNQTFTIRGFPTKIFALIFVVITL